MKIGIVMVSVNCFELSKKSYESVKTKYPHLFIWIANGSTDETLDFFGSEEAIAKNKTGELMTIANPQNSGLSACWNLGIEKAFENGCDYVLVMNNDVLLCPTTIDNLVTRIEKGDAVMVTAVNVQFASTPEEIVTVENDYRDENDNEHPDFSCFMISRQTLSKIGIFDENYYVAYFEDNDYHGRIAMLGEKAITIACAPYYHYGSQTTKQNPHLRSIIEEAFIRNREYFARKFGMIPLSDVPLMRERYFKTPYNDPRKSWKDTTIPLAFIRPQPSRSEEEQPAGVSE